MSFNNYAQKVRDSTLSFITRRSALSSCIGKFCWLTNQSYQRVRTSYADKFGFDNLTQQDDTTLIMAIDELTAERNRFLEKLRAFQHKRIRDKMRGRRKPTKSDIKKLYESLLSK